MTPLSQEGNSREQTQDIAGKVEERKFKTTRFVSENTATQNS